MCGRYSISATPEEIAAYFGLTALSPIAPRYNVAPSQLVPVVRHEHGSPVLSLVSFGWQKPGSHERVVNARAETVATLPLFRRAFKDARCLVVASGFFEWQRRGKQKRPSFVRPKGGGVLAFAGLVLRDDAGESCVIVTTAANHLVAELHDRMPAVVPRDAVATWLDPATPPAALASLLTPVADEALEAWPVSTRVSSPANEGPDLVERVDDPQGRLF